MAIWAALIAALAVIGAALLNAALSRQRDDRVRLENAKALAAAFSAEIEQAVAIANERITGSRKQAADLERNPDRKTAQIPFPMMRIWESSHSRVGELPVVLASELVAFHTFMADVESYFSVTTALNLQGPETLRASAKWLEIAVAAGGPLVQRLRAFAGGGSEANWPAAGPRPVVGSLDL